MTQAANLEQYRMPVVAFYRATFENRRARWHGGDVSEQIIKPRLPAVLHPREEVEKIENIIIAPLELFAPKRHRVLRAERQIHFVVITHAHIDIVGIVLRGIGDR